MKLYTIAYLIVVVPVGLRLIWELIPDPVKKWWSYGRMVRQDRRRGKSRSYIFKFRDGISREK